MLPKVHIEKHENLNSAILWTLTSLKRYAKMQIVSRSLSLAEIRIKGNTQGQNVGHNFVAEVMLLICACEHGGISTKSSKAKLICFC